MGVDDLVVAPILIAGAKVVGAAMIKYYNITYNLTIFLNEFFDYDRHRLPSFSMYYLCYLSCSKYDVA